MSIVSYTNKLYVCEYIYVNSCFRVSFKSLLLLSSGSSMAARLPREVTWVFWLTTRQLEQALDSHSGPRWQLNSMAGVSPVTALTTILRAGKTHYSLHPGRASSLKSLASYLASGMAFRTQHPTPSP